MKPRDKSQESYVWRSGRRDDPLKLEAIRIFQTFALYIILASEDSESHFNYKVKTTFVPPLLHIKHPYNRTPPLTNLRGGGGIRTPGPPFGSAHVILNTFYADAFCVVYAGVVEKIFCGNKRIKDSFNFFVFCHQSKLYASKLWQLEYEFISIRLIWLNDFMKDEGP